MNPQHARWHFKFRSLINFLSVAFVFAVVVIISMQIDGGFIVILIAGGIAYFTYVHVLESRAISIACPECRKIIATNTPWICGVCQGKNHNGDEFPFVNRCEHCGAEPKAYKCHHRGCGKLIFLTEDHQEENFAYCLTAPAPPAPDETKEEISSQEREKRRLEHQLIMTRLTAKLNEVKRLVDPPEEKAPKKILEEKFSRDKGRFLGAEEIGERELALNAIENKDNPEKFERQSEWIKQWVRDHTL